MKKLKNNFTVCLILLMVLGALTGILVSQIQMGKPLLSLSRDSEAFYFRHTSTIYLVLPLTSALLALGAYPRGEKTSR